jgi:sulfur dioxygenase
MNQVKTASPQEVATIAGRVRLVDVREPSEFVGELRHVAGAELVPLATVLERAAAWPKHEPIVCVCRSGNRSGRAAEALVALGFADVTNMAGGMLAWNEAGLPVA